ncbi:MAG: sulfotransferase domain-containing protein [Aquisalimonadaceae bacterium]
MKPLKRIRRWWLRRTADVHILSFPKCGRTWLVLMLSKVMEEQYGIQLRNPLRLRDYHKKNRRVPLILQHHDGGPEFQRVEQLNRDKQEYAGRKVLFLVRDPRDVTVSAYFQKTKRNYNYEGELKDYVYEPVGSIETNIEFYNIWARNRHIPSDFLLMTYEDMHADTERELRRAVDFIGLENVSDETISRAVEFCRFENMRKLESSNALGSRAMAPRDAKDESTYKTREGRIGGYAKHLDAEEIAHIDRLIDERLAHLYAAYRRIDA